MRPTLAAVILVSLTFQANLHADTGPDDAQALVQRPHGADAPAGSGRIDKFRVDELALLPHPGKLFRQGSIQLTPEQQQRLRQDVKAVYPPLFHPKMQQAFELQRRLQRAVAEGKSKEEVKELLDEMASVKRAAMDLRIDALNALRDILTPEQWDAVNRLSYQ
jgi:Spy/CpxP family protein refolding chaperone